MSKVAKLLAGCGAVAAVGIAAPASAQYYPGYGGYAAPGYGTYPAPGYGGYQGYGYRSNQQILVNECAAAVQQRLGGYGGGRVLGISSVTPRDDGGIAVRGVASSGGGYAYGYGARPVGDLSFRCRTDGRGYIREVTLSAGDSRFRYGEGNSTPYNDDFSEFGYRRY